MKRHTDWNEEPELRDDIYQALEDAGIDAYGSEEQGEYREQGTITVRTQDGRRFALEIHELS